MMKYMNAIQMTILESQFTTQNELSLTSIIEFLNLY